MILPNTEKCRKPSSHKAFYWNMHSGFLIVFQKLFSRKLSNFPIFGSDLKMSWKNIS